MKNYRLLRQPTAGFTLIELLVIIIMVGVLFAIAAPGWLAFINRQRLGTANEQILQTLRTAQIEAKRTRTYREARFDTTADPPRVAVLPLTSTNVAVTGTNITVVNLSRMTNAQVTQWETLGQGNVKSGVLTFKTSNTPNDYIIFSPDGSVASTTQAPNNPTLSQPFTVTLALAQSSSVKRCVSVQTLLGAVSQAADANCPP